MNTFAIAALKVLQEANKPLHYKEIVQLALDQGLITTTGTTPDATMNARLSVEIKAKGEQSRFIRTESGVFALNPKINVSLDEEEEIEEIEEQEKIATSYTGKAGEYLVCSKLLFNGFNASIMTVDTGLDVIAEKGGKTFGIQVKTANLTQGDVYVFDLRKASFEKHQDGAVFYIFVLHSSSKDSFIIIPFSQLRKMIEEKIVLEVGRGLRYRVNIKEREGKFSLGNKENDITYYLNRWDLVV